MSMKENNMTIENIAELNEDVAVVAGQGTAGAGWYAIMLWPSGTIVQDNLTDIGSHAEWEANRLARRHGLLTGAQYSARIREERAAEDAAQIAFLNSTEGRAMRRETTNAIRARAGLPPLETEGAQLK